MSASESNKVKQNRSLILLALMFTMMLAAMDVTIVSTAIPQIVGDLGGFSLFSWVYSIYLLAQTVTIPIYGKLADLYGRKPILIIGMVIFLMGSAASGMSWNMISLIVFRGIQGLGAGSIMATVNTIAGDIYSIEERAKIQGWLSSVWAMAAIAGPAIGGAFAEHANWRWIFLINIPIGIAAISLLAISLKEKVVKHEHKVDYRGAVMTLISGFAILFTLMNLGQNWKLLSIESLGMIALSILLIWITLRIEGKSPEPIMPKWIWKDRTLVGANLATIGMGAMMMGPNMYLPVFSQSVIGLGAIAAGFVLASMSIGWPVASSLSGLFYMRIGFRNTAVIGTSIIVFFSLLFLFIPFDVPVWLLVLDQVMLGAGFGLLSTPTLVGVQATVPWQQRGVVTGANMFSRYLGQSIGAAILGGVFNMAMLGQLKSAPEVLKGSLPLEVNDVIAVLQSGQSSEQAQEYLRHAFYISSHQVYAGMAIIGFLTIVFLYLQPKKIKTVQD